MGRVSIKRKLEIAAYDRQNMQKKASKWRKSFEEVAKVLSRDDKKK